MQIMQSACRFTMKRTQILIKAAHLAKIDTFADFQRNLTASANQFYRLLFDHPCTVAHNFRQLVGR
jgi:hypothetical protein